MAQNHSRYYLFIIFICYCLLSLIISIILQESEDFEHIVHNEEQVSKDMSVSWPLNKLGKIPLIYLLNLSMKCLV